MLNLTVIPPANSEATYFTVSFNPWDFRTSRNIHASGPYYSTVFRNLQPATKYNFIFFSGAIAEGLDIRSDTRYKSGFTPPECKFIYSLPQCLKTWI